MGNSAAVNTALDAEIDELDMLLAEEIEEEIEADQTDKPVKIEVSSDDMDLDLESLDEDLEAADAATVDAPVKIKKKEPKVKATKAKATSSSPRFNSTENLVEFGKKVLDGAEMSLDANSEASTQECLERLEGVKPVKVREKLANLLLWAVKGKSLSKYTQVTLDLIAKAEGPVTKADIRNNLLDAKVKLSTASSQAGQMTHILTAAQIVVESGNAFTVNEGSTLLALYEDRFAQEATETKD